VCVHCLRALGARMGKYTTFDAGEVMRVCFEPAALLFPGQIKREKGVWWMPRQQEAMKDVIPCVKLWGAGNRL
jgi:hypothetical protein